MDKTSSEGTGQGMAMAQHDVRRLVRRKDHKVIAGVATGLGAYFGVDPVWFRLGFVFTAFLGGAGLVAYIVLWFVMPCATDVSAEPAPIERHAERIAHSIKTTPSWIGFALLGIGALIVATQVVHWRPAVFWGVALIVLGIFLFRRMGEPSAVAAPALQEATTVARPDTPDAQPLAPPLATPAAPSLPRARRERSRLGWLTLGAALVALGIAATLDRAGAVHVTLVQYLALALAIVGIGMAVGAVWGRARWLVVPAIALVPFVLAASLITVPFKGGFAYEVLRPTTVQSIRPEYHLVGGRLVLDLRGVKFGPTPVAIVVTDVFGRILVRVPANARLDVRARAGAGRVILFGRNFDGVKVDVQRTYPSNPSPGPQPQLTLDLEASMGQVEVSS